MSEVLWNVRLLDLEAGRAAERRAITVDDGRVRAIDAAEGQAPAGARDLGGATVLPGLIDAHCHVLSTTERSPGFGPPPPLHGEAPRPAALGHYILAGAGERIVRSGFTTVRDVGSDDDEARALEGPRSTSGSCRVRGPVRAGASCRRRHRGASSSESMYREADGPWEMRKAVREQIRRGADYIKFMATGARSVVAEDPEPPQMTLEEMTSIVDEAHRMGRRVAAHAEGLAGTRWAIEAGADTIEHGLSLHRDPALLDTMAGRGTVLVPTLTTFHDLAHRFAADFAPALVEQAKRQLEESLETVAAARVAGVILALGYDSGPPGASANELLRLGEAGLSPIEALRAATIGGAAALGCPDLGRIAVEAIADLVVVDGQPDADLRLLTQSGSILEVRRSGDVVN